MQYFKYTYLFQNCDKMDWISKISSWNSNMENARIKGECIEIRFGKNVEKNKFFPFHIVTLSCFIESAKQKGYLIYLQIEDPVMRKFILEDVNITKYWSGGKYDHIDSPDPARLNLWRVVEGKAEEYEISVHRYFSEKFPNTDFFMLKSCLTELYFNIFDHAEAKGVDFSYIHYDESEEIIHIAICDFGKGIAKTVRKAYPDIRDDKNALLMSLKRGITSRSNTHNAGFGLDTVVSAIADDDSVLRIVSNNALLLCAKNKGVVETKIYDIPFHLKGTLIYLDLPISSFEETEINEEYTF